MVVASNTSPIMNLTAVEQLVLLQQLYAKVIIPQAVYEELVIGGEQPGSTEVQTFGWIETKSVTDQTLVTALLGELDRGEAEAIALAKELQAERLLLDERRGRAVAFRFGLRVTGVLGVLIEAKRKGHLQIVKPVLDALVAEAGFWVSPQLYRRVLQAAGE